MKYQLTFDEYLLFTAMLIYIEKDGNVSKLGEEGSNNDIDSDIIHRIIPETIFKLKNYT